MGVIFTFAELEYLLAQSRARSDINAMLNLPAGDPSDELLAQAGLASLCARGLGRIRDEQAELAPEVNLIAALLDRCDRWLDLMHVVEPGPMSQFIGWTSVSSDPGLLISAVIPGCFRVDALDSALSPTDRVMSVVGSLVDQDAANVMYVQHAGIDASRIAVARTADGEWLYAEDEDATLTAMPREDVLVRAKARLERILVSIS